MEIDIISVDLNPLSRTAQTSTVTIVDNIVRVIPALIESVKKYENYDKTDIQEKIDLFNNKTNLNIAINDIIKRFE